MLRKLKIWQYSFMYNEIEVLPFAVEYWKTYADKVIIYDSNSNDGSLEYLNNVKGLDIEIRKREEKYANTIDDENLTYVKNNIWKEARNYDVDYVIMCDIDEVLMSGGNIRDEIYKMKENGQTILHPNGYQLFTDKFPEYRENVLLHEYEPKVLYDKMYSKRILFDPKKITEINYTPGAHVCNPIGDVKYYSFDNAYLLHLNNFSSDFKIRRFERNKARLCEKNIKYGWGIHYSQTREQIINSFNNDLKRCTTINEVLGDRLKKKCELISNNENKIAIILHIYYKDVWENKIRPRLLLMNEKYNFDLYVTISCQDYDDILEEIFEFNTKYVRKINNIGEDIRGFFMCLQNIFKENKQYDQILKIHTKHDCAYTNLLLDALLQNDQENIIKLFNNKSIGMIGPKKCMGNAKNGDVDTHYFTEISNMIGNKTQSFRCVYGTMFWIRFNILEKYFKNSKLTYQYFDQPYAKNSTKMHSMERVFGAIVKDAGYEYAEIYSNYTAPSGPPPISTFLGQTNATPNQPKFIQYTPPKNQNREIENNIVKKVNENNNTKTTNVRSQLPPRRQMSRALATFLR